MRSRSEGQGLRTRQMGRPRLGREDKKLKGKEVHERVTVGAAQRAAGTVQGTAEGGGDDSEVGSPQLAATPAGKEKKESQSS